MGGNRLENLQFLGFFGDFGIISYSAQNHGLGPKICKYVLWHQKQSCRGWNLDQFCHQGQPSSIFGSKVMGRQSLTYFLAPNWERRPFGTIFHCRPKEISIGCQSDNFDPRRSAHGSSESLCPKFSETHVEMVSIFKILGASLLQSHVILAPNWELKTLGPLGPLQCFSVWKFPFHESTYQLCWCEIRFTLMLQKYSSCAKQSNIDRPGTVCFVRHREPAVFSKIFNKEISTTLVMNICLH